jgi:hypothetical protein
MSKERLTAEQARIIVGKTLDEKIDCLLESVLINANDKKRSLKCGWEHDEDRDLWIDGGYHSSVPWSEAKKILEDLGYKVSFYYKESQFVDMYTLIEW